MRRSDEARDVVARLVEEAKVPRRSLLRLHWILLAVGLLDVHSMLGAQVVSAVLLQPDSVTPAEGVLIVAARAGMSQPLAKTVTNAAGRFELRVPVGLVEIRALRIGQQPYPLGAWQLVAGQRHDFVAVLPNTPIVLQQVVTRVTRQCRLVERASAATVAVFEEARTALLASEAYAEGPSTNTRYSTFSALQDRRGRPLMPPEERVTEGPSLRAFGSVPPDSLALVGFMTEEVDGTVYRAPDAAVLLSDAFARTHCLRLVAGTGANATLLGVEFEPVAKRSGIVDITGTLWVDRATSELQRLEFSYIGLPMYAAASEPGGTVEYARLADGMWFIARWAIRMPRVTATQRMELSQQGAAAPRDARVDAMQVAGGEVWRITRGTALLYTNGREEPRESMGAPLPVDAPVARLASDTVALASLCAGNTPTDTTAELFGVVLDNASRPVGGAQVYVEWKQEFRNPGRDTWTWQTRRLSTEASSGGRYAICGVPRRRSLTLVASSRDSAVGRMTARVSEFARQARADVRIFAARVAEGSRAGVGMVRVVDAAGQPVSHALVEIRGGRGRITDDDGRLFASVSGNSISLRARRIGMRPFDGTVVRSPATGEFVVRLAPVPQTLGAVVVTARATTLLDRAGFYDRMLRAQRGAMVADFVTPEEIDARAESRVSHLVEGRGAVQLGRTPGARARTFLVGRRGCQLVILVDGQLVRPEVGGGVKAVFLDEIVDGKGIAGIEIYPNGTNVPVELMVPIGAIDDASCGVVAIWTGRVW